MAPSSSSSVLLLSTAFCIVLLFSAADVCGDATVNCGIDAIYQLGDSMSDTGNFMRESPSLSCSMLPYGETYFKKPTGRCSDGLLLIDFIAKAFDLPLLEPYLNKDALLTHGHGVNFAVAGATALSGDALAAKNISSPFTNTSLSVQLDWLFSYLNGICYAHEDCAKKLKSAVFIVGEIGGNDYHYALIEGKTLNEVKTLVTQIAQVIKDSIRRIIDMGATRVIVPGNFPMGCFPMYLTAFKSNNSVDYDEYRCLKGFNNLSLYHNRHLKNMIEELKKERPSVVIVYTDYYKAFMRMIRNPSAFGLDPTAVHKSCCGAGGDYNFDLGRICGYPGLPVCAQPNKYITWDGIHLTQKGAQVMAKWVLRKILQQLHC